MIAKQVPNRHDGKSDFGTLAKYLTSGFSDEQLSEMAQAAPGFGKLTRYVSQESNEAGKDKCVAVCLNRLLSVGGAVAQFYSTAMKNPAVDNPVVHLIVSWPEHERPSHDAVFGAARDVLKSLNLHDHQWLMAIHDDTDNLHCHIEVSRIHPDTYRSQHLPWMHRTLHRAAREIEIRNGWSHDNGLFVVQEMPDGRKFVVPNESYRETEGVRHETYVEKLARMEAWSDERPLVDLCRNVVAPKLVTAMAMGPDWTTVHAVLEQHGMRLERTDEGKFRLQAMNAAGRIIHLPISRALHGVKLDDAETGLGAFTASVRRLGPVPLTSNTGPLAKTDAAAVDKHDKPSRDPLKREGRRLERAAERTGLIERFKAERQHVQAERAKARQSLKAVSEEMRTQLTDMKNRFRQRKRDALESGLTSAQRAALHSVSAFERMSESAQIKAVAEARRVALLADRPGLLSWRAWLEKEAQAGDKAALSALRGIVYQEGRDAKKGTVEDREDMDALTDDAEKVLSGLLEHEWQEHAIRPATPGRIRAYQADALVRDIQGMKWKVTNNGNVEYQRASGSTVFVDRGHRLTFDRQLVTDEDLALTLIHAREKWAAGIVLTGGDPAFTHRMIQAAVEAGVKIKNPELQHMQAKLIQQRRPAETGPEANPIGPVAVKPAKTGKRRR